MVGEAHLVGEAVYLLFVDRRQVGTYLLGRYTYTGLQHFLGQAQLFYAMCVEKRKRSNK